MTFLEAAIEILRSTEEPLHFNDIARLAVERKLLSHVGRDPNAAMRTCLNSAVRSKAHNGLVMRSKPGHYRLRPGVEVPDSPPAPSHAEPLPDAEVQKASNSKPKASDSSTRDQKKTEPPAAAARGRKKLTRERAKPADPARETQAELELAPPEAPVAAEAKPVSAAGVPMPELDPSKVRFRGPEGSGLEDDTDVTLVMANAMSRLVDERPDLREELEAMQKGPSPAPEVIEVGRKTRRDRDRERDRDGEADTRESRGRDRDRDRDRDSDGSRDRDDDRGGRKRRRRRRRGRRVEWSDANAQRSDGARSGEELLDTVARVLSEAGARSLHVRQIAENLANQDVLGGEISEIERAVTAAILLDVHNRGDASRFAVRGDARYQLRGSRLPEKAAAAEHAMRTAIRELEKETSSQLLLWLQSLGARSLESFVRIWLAHEGFGILATLPPARGLSKLVVEDPDPDDDDGRTLVLIVPRKTALEPKLWEGEAERNSCGNTLVFAMCDSMAEQAGADTRVVFAREFVRWLLRSGIGVRSLNIQVPVLDADLIESIGGLDT
ncbi:winged helix-turn-helix domain-containing protein [Enhygromyxa salina]|uniref:HTH HARE-type domain-containing protein n=1 Tax=Enhygromyxa salina TaxID=215803 RepID=A0A2S9YW17_9BACT|nr:winged helix-turn-helix domain-containing protein [Enhygromyxa salina]PRQ09280.1 hypothetical protein ENSA7_09720 [Enhygromyxa salina]